MQKQLPKQWEMSSGGPQRCHPCWALSDVSLWQLGSHLPERSESEIPLFVFTSPIQKWSKQQYSAVQVLRGNWIQKKLLATFYLLLFCNWKSPVIIYLIRLLVQPMQCCQILQLAFCGKFSGFAKIEDAITTLTFLTISWLHRRCICFIFLLPSWLITAICTWCSHCAGFQLILI